MELFKKMRIVNKKLKDVNQKLTQDRVFLFETIKKDIPEIVPKIVPKEKYNEIGKMNISIVIIKMMRYYSENGMSNIFNTFENVITYFYKYDSKKEGSLLISVDLLAEDFISYMINIRK